MGMDTSTTKIRRIFEEQGIQTLPLFQQTRQADGSCKLMRMDGLVIKVLTLVCVAQDRWVALLINVNGVHFCGPECTQKRAFVI